jgi:ribose transport system ATP-binding protein
LLGRAGKKRRAMSANVLVSAQGVTKSFGSTKALVDVSITLLRGEIHALLGGNGAGKSTLIGILSQNSSPDGGAIHFGTEKVAVVHQELAILPELTVAENITIGTQRGPAFTWRRAAEETERVLEMLGQGHGEIRPETIAGTLQLHQMQLVEIARALSSGADLILLDEPTASLTLDETGKLFAVLRALRAKGIGLVLVSHRMHEIRQVADRATVLRDGRTVVDRRALSEIDDATILREMFGTALLSPEGEHPIHATTTPAPNSQTGLHLHHKATGIRVDVAPGSIIGLAGTPQGPASLFDTLLGLSRDDGWEAIVEGKPWRPRSPRAAVKRGLGYISGDRAAKGVFPELSIRDNAMIARQVVRRVSVRRPSEIHAVRAQAAALGFSHVDVEAPPRSLSGGTMQKVLIARWLDLPLKVLLLEEPTRGVDVRTKTDLYAMIRTLAESGVVVLWWSTENRELLSISSQILAFTVNGDPQLLVDTRSTNEAELVHHTGTT